jgi:hypothetical protein
VWASTAISSCWFRCHCGDTAQLSGAPAVGRAALKAVGGQQHRPGSPEPQKATSTWASLQTPSASACGPSAALWPIKLHAVVRMSLALVASLHRTTSGRVMAPPASPGWRSERGRSTFASCSVCTRSSGKQEFSPDRLDRSVLTDESSRMFDAHVLGRLRSVTPECVRSTACLYTVSVDSGFSVDAQPCRCAGWLMPRHADRAHAPRWLRQATPCV